jgi:hypothetical protein
MSHPDPTPMTMEAVQAALRELNDRWAGFAIRDESIINAEIRADLRAKYGWEIEDRRARIGEAWASWRPRR